jgi:hypothetical protein
MPVFFMNFTLFVSNVPAEMAAVRRSPGGYIEAHCEHSRSFLPLGNDENSQENRSNSFADRNCVSQTFSATLK